MIAIDWALAIYAVLVSAAFLVVAIGGRQQRDALRAELNAHEVTRTAYWEDVTRVIQPDTSGSGTPVHDALVAQKPPQLVKGGRR